MTNTIMLTQKIKKSGYTKKHISSKLGLSYYGFLLKVNGENEFKQTEIAILTDLLRLTPEERDLIFFSY